MTVHDLEQAMHPASEASMRRGAKDTATYVAGSLAYKLVAFLAVPLLARLLAPEELGLLDLSVVVAGVVAVIVGTGMDHAVTRFEPEHQGGGLWTTAITIIGVAAVVILVMALVLAPVGSAAFFGSAANATLFLVAVGYGTSLAMMTTAMNAVRLYAGPRRYATIGFALLVVEMATAVALAAIHVQPVGIVAAWTVVSVAAALAVGVGHIPRLRRLEGDLARSLLTFGLPLVPAALAWSVGDLVIRASVAGSGDFAGLGAYGLAHRVTSVLGLAIAGFALAWQPLVYRADRAAQAAIASRGLTLVVAVTGVAAIALTAFAKELVGLLGGAPYIRGAHVVPLLGLAALFASAFSMLNVLASIRYRTWRVAALAFIGVAAQIMSAILLVPMTGIEGAASASAIGYLLAATGLFAVVGWSAEDKPAALKTAAAALLAAASLTMSAYLGADMPMEARLAIAAGSALPLGLLALSALREQVRGLNCRGRSS